MSHWDIREAICEVGRRVWQRSMVASNDGNISHRLDESTVLATPTMIGKGFMTPDDLVLVDLDGNQTGGTRKLTSEIRLHLNAYRRRPDLRSVLHVHPPHATAFAITATPLPKCILSEIELFIGEVPLVPYLAPGSWEFARSLDPWIDTHDVFLLESHGAVTFGLDPFDAYYRMETLDQYCRILLLAKELSPDWRRLDRGELQGLLDEKAKWGVADPRAGLPDAQWCDPRVTPRKRADAATPFRDAPFDGAYWPQVEDSPKILPTPTPAPLDPADLDEQELRAVIEEVVRRMTES